MLNLVKDSNPISVMFVDDQPSFRTIVKEILSEAENIFVETSSSVDAALKLIKKKKIDIIVSDYQMPEKNGIEFLKILRSKKNNIPFIMFTGKGREEVIIEALDNGCNGYINKIGDPKVVFKQLIYRIRHTVKAVRDSLANFENENRYRLLFQNSPIPIYVEDHSELKKYLDQLKKKGITDFEKFFTKNPKEIDICIKKIKTIEINTKGLEYQELKKNSKNTVDQHKKNVTQNRASYIKQFISLSKNSKKYSIMKTTIDEKGKIRKIQTIFLVSTNREDDFSRIYIITLDITDLISLEMKYLELEESYTNLFKHLDLGIAIYKSIDNGNDFIFTDINPAVRKIENISKENAIGKSVKEVFPGIVEMGLFDVFKQVWKTGKPIHYKKAFYIDNKRKGWRDNFVYKLKTGEIVALYKDLTEK
ncbi:MAG: response regulator [Candidatus Ranarchaeia archaeon]